MTPQTYTALRTDALTYLQDAGSAIFATADLDLIMADALREFATISPYVARVPYTIESRYGQATATSANNLVDTYKGQFLAADVGKMVYNLNMKTWAVITSYASSTSVGLSKDIMQSTDAYKIFNKNTASAKQINISDVTDYIEVVRAEYPFGTRRNVIHDWANPDIVEIDMAGEPQDSMALSTRTQPDTQVFVYFNKRHKVSQLTDLSAVLAASCAAGATTISGSALQTAGTIEADQEFSIANVRGTYWTTVAVAVTATTAAISFYPPLESAVASTGVVITFRQSTLKPQEEPVFVQYIAGKAAVSKSMLYYQQVNSTIATLAAATVAIAAVSGKVASATTLIASGTTNAAAMTVQIAAATTEVGKIVTEVGLAMSALVSATSLINTVPLGGGAGDWWQQEAGRLATAGGELQNAVGYLQVASADGVVASHQTQLANASLAAAGASVNEAISNLRLVGTRLEVSRGGQTLEAWGQRQMSEAMARLRTFQGVKASRKYAR